ncbi:MAG: hypothetical protein Ctma_0220 [Catillopecten margaritatus gill symbiont]|uniref:YhdP central domain-containing protein n=1 Tax=Catillopecten margaritatus gill symbiont TaxID=3083288 RepID=A0AAU6PEV1_9GAMM
MRKRIVHHSIRFAKFSTWAIGISTVLVVLLVTALMVFPRLAKASIETQLSQLSGVTIQISDPHLGFDFNKGYLTLNIDDLKATEQQIPIATINALKWDIHLSSLFEDVYHLSEIFVNKLTVHSGAIEFNIVEIKQLAMLLNAKEFDFFKSLNIGTTIVKDAEGDKEFEIADMLLTRNKLKITGQNLSFGLWESQSVKVDIDITLPNIPSENTPLIVPILISNDELSINSKVKIFNEKGDDWFEFKGHLGKIQANSFAKYLSPQWLGNSTYDWIKRGFIAGTLQDTKLNIKKNLSKSSAIDTQFSTELKDMVLLFDSDWNPLKQLNASLVSDGKKIKAMVHSAKLNNMTFKNIEAQIADLSQKNLDVEVNGKIDTQSEQLIAFLKHVPLSKEINETLRQFTLSGKMDGKIQLLIPLDERTSILDVDLKLKNNHLSVLDGAVEVKDYNSRFRFRDNKITAAGAGNIRGLPFDIHINPDNRKNDESTFGVELVNSDGFETYISKRFDQSWRVKIESKSVKGNVAIFLNENDIPNVRLLNMQVTTLDAIKGDWKVTPEDFPDMHLSTQEIYIDENVLPNLSVELTSKDNLLTIKDLQFKGVEVGDKALNFHGFWVDGRTRLYAHAKGKGLAEFLKNLKIKEKVTGGEFDFDIRLSCECAPWNMNYQDITGYLDLNVKKGVFTDKDPNLGRILSLLNINSIAKRLKLDVSDVTNKGFTYESIEAQIHLGNATVSIDEFNLESLSSQITLVGQGDIIKKEYDLVAKVAPAVSDAVPVATYLAGGGLLGLSAWLADKALFDGKIIDSIVDEVVEFKYKITGPWDNPTIKKL